MRIVVAGCGPAGIVTASALAGLGHRIALLAPPRHNPAMEGLSFRVLEGLRAAGLASVIENISAPVPRASAWNGHEREAGEEWLIERAQLDAALIEAAHAFAEIRPAHLTSVTQAPDDVSAHITDVDGTASTLSADFLVDARGRAAPGGLPRTTGPATVALCRRYNAALPPSTWLETSPRGWAWLAAPRTGPAYLQITVDAARGSVPGRAGLDMHFDTLKAEFPGVASRLAKSEAVGPVFARLSTVGMAHEAVAGRILRAGDAALAMDPLSGHGVFEAIAGAFAAAATINTALHRPDDRALATRFYNERVQSTFQARTQSGLAYYRLEDRWADAPFWLARRNWPAEAPAPTRTAILRRAVIDRGWIRECEVIVTPEEPRGVWLRDGVDVVALWRLQKSGGIDGPEAAAKALGVPVGAAAAALGWLAGLDLPSTEQSGVRAP